MSEQAHIGVIGMGVMGTSLARNLARRGYTTAIWNLEPERTHQVAATYADEGTFWAYDDLAEMIVNLERPRKLLLMVTAGRAVDAVIGNVRGLLEPGDIIIDAGNSLFTDTRRREQDLAADDLHFMGVGVSGGEVGALEGPSIMPGGSLHAYAAVGPILEAIAAQVDGDPCCAHMGADGAGHFVKMVHNGIEYADMQLIAEAYQIMRGAGMEPAAIAEVFREWNDTDLESYLIEITADILAFVDARTGRPFVDIVEDAAAQKGTGSWTVQAALELGVPVPAIAEAVFARSVSGHREMRDAARGTLRGPDGVPPVDGTFLDDLRQALWASKVVAYAQGLDEIRLAAREYGWDTDPGEVAKVWRDGCIIRARLLSRIRDEYAAHDLSTLLVAPSVVEELATAQAPWRRVIAFAVATGVPVPAMSSALAYYDSARSDRLPAALVQAQRDYFGAHTYRRVDVEGSYHTLWSGDRSEERTDQPQDRAEAADKERQQAN